MGRKSAASIADALEARAKQRYEEGRLSVEGRPAWEDLNPSDPYDQGMRQAALRLASKELKQLPPDPKDEVVRRNLREAERERLDNLEDERQMCQNEAYHVTTYWSRRGRAVSAWVEPVKDHSKPDSPITGYVTRSDLVNGMPRRRA